MKEISYRHWKREQGTQKEGWKKKKKDDAKSEKEVRGGRRRNANKKGKIIQNKQTWG